MNLFENVLNRHSGQKITAHFRDGSSATYTVAVLDLLKSDPSVYAVTDGSTGEVIFARDW